MRWKRGDLTLIYIVDDLLYRVVKKAVDVHKIKAN